MVSGVGDAEDAATDEPAGPGARQLTAVALFEDAIDAESALRALERGAGTADQVSLLVRARAVDPADAADRPGAVARSLVATALETAGGSLLGLASLVVPERGPYLVAGPLGAALTGAAAPGTLPSAAGRPEAEPAGADPAGVLRALVGFGFAADEATYLERRLAAGAILIAVTSADPRQLTGVRQLFADHNAVHISQGPSASRLAAAAATTLGDLLRATAGGDAEVEPPPLRRLCQDPFAGADACGAIVVDRFGDDAGTVDELLADEPAVPGDAEPVVRYVVVEFGGVLGLGRQRVAVPPALVDLTSRPVHVLVERKVLQHAPRFAGDLAFSRREQLAVCAYFGLTPYWLTES